MIHRMHSGLRLVQFFAHPQEDTTVTLFAVLADDGQASLYVAGAKVARGADYPAVTPNVPAAHVFEREIYEQSGLLPQGHPWLKPVRKGIAGIDPSEMPYEFFRMNGDEVHEVGVGPIHAGVIEPGHFRFSCTGETVHHLEIELGFQHRGLEALMIRNQHPLYQMKLAETIAGDTVIGHGTAFVNAMEALGGVRCPRRAEQIRVIALELERVGVHLGDLSALSGDVAYLTGQSVFGAMRTQAINTSMVISGSRFGRGLLTPGGVRFDISGAMKRDILSTVDELQDKTELAAEVLFTSSSVLSRFERTGIISEATARNIGLVGPAGRASGIPIDVRADFPFGAYASFPVHAFSLKSGDVFARAYLRYVEIIQSLRIIREQVETLGDGPVSVNTGPIKGGQFVVSLCEGWRGEIAHTVITGRDGRCARYKIKDPSFNNWFGLALAVRMEGISDFPLCNKSFNLSYCGFDL
ncbi:NADH-quinone oxidoreductase subunit C [bacterium]|nr:NADH-quinone oxidoreductase subunit C [bacterium]